MLASNSVSQTPAAPGWQTGLASRCPGWPRRRRGEWSPAPASPDEPSGGGNLLGHPEDAVVIGRGSEACPHVHHHRVDEAFAEAFEARRILFSAGRT